MKRPNQFSKAPSFGSKTVKNPDFGAMFDQAALGGTVKPLQKITSLGPNPKLGRTIKCQSDVSKLKSFMLSSFDQKHKDQLKFTQPEEHDQQFFRTEAKPDFGTKFRAAREQVFGAKTEEKYQSNINRYQKSKTTPIPVKPKTPIKMNTIRSPVKKEKVVSIAHKNGQTFELDDPIFKESKELSSLQVDFAKLSPHLTKIVKKYGLYKHPEWLTANPKAFYFCKLKDFIDSHTHNQYKYSGLVSVSSGLPEGQGYVIDRSGSRLIEGTFYRGRLYGYGRIISTTANKNNAESLEQQIQCVNGSFLAGYPHGTCSVNFDDSGIVFFEGTFEHGKQEGPGIEINSLNGSIKEGHFSSFEMQSNCFQVSHPYDILKRTGNARMDQCMLREDCTKHQFEYNIYKASYFRQKFDSKQKMIRSGVKVMFKKRNAPEPPSISVISKE